MELKIRSSKNYNLRSRTVAFSRFGAVFISGILLSFLIADRDYANAAIGVSFLFGVLISIRTRFEMNESFKCKGCGKVIEHKVKNSGADYEPILYHCSSCEILWYTGNVDN
ncbi:MAG: hypothetical protein JXR18_02115 [Neptuniibacter sp.]